MRNYLTNQSLPTNVPKTTLWRWKNKWDQYQLVNDRIVSKIDDRIHSEDVQKDLQNEWKNVLSGRDKFYYYMKQKYDNVTQNDVMTFLKGNDTMSVHRPPKTQKIFRTIVSTKPNDRWQCDFIYMPKYLNMEYVFTLIDHNSKHAWAWKTTSRDHKKLIPKIKDVFLKYKPKILQCDNEFRSQEFQKLCSESGTRIINSSPYKPNSNGCIEKFNKRLKEILYRMMTEEGSKDWPSLLEKSMEVYNNTWHRTVGATPKHNFDNQIPFKMENTSTDPPKFKVGDTLVSIFPQETNLENHSPNNGQKQNTK